MTWITIILTISLLILMIISAYIFFEESECCVTGWRDVLSVSGIIGLVFFTLFVTVYTLSSELEVKMTEITPTFISKSKTKVYLEFDSETKHFEYSYSDAKNFNLITDSTKFYLYESINHWNYHSIVIKKQSRKIGLKKNELGKWIKNRW